MARKKKKGYKYEDPIKKQMFNSRDERMMKHIAKGTPTSAICELFHCTDSVVYRVRDKWRALQEAEAVAQEKVA